MADGTTIDCRTGKATVAPLSPGDQADFDARQAAAPAIVAAQVAAATNLNTLQTHASGAISANLAYLTIVGPTPAQIAAQVALLTRESTALIRLLLAQFDSVAGT